MLGHSGAKMTWNMNCLDFNYVIDKSIDLFIFDAEAEDMPLEIWNMSFGW